MEPQSHPPQRVLSIDGDMRIEEFLASYPGEAQQHSEGFSSVNFIMDLHCAKWHPWTAWRALVHPREGWVAVRKDPSGRLNSFSCLVENGWEQQELSNHQKRSVESGNTPYIPETCRASWISLLHFIYVIVKQKLKPQSTSALHVFFLRE